MSTQFDASQINLEPLSESVIAAHKSEVETTMKMPGALANAKLHAQNELNRLVQACNRLVWGTLPDSMRAPTAEEIEQVLTHFRDDDRAKLVRDAKLAAEQRHLVSMLAEAELAQIERDRKEQEDLARIEAEQQEMAEFELYDAARKKERFEAWRASRRS